MPPASPPSIRAILALLATCLLAPAWAHAEFATVRVATGLERPVFLTSPPGDTTRAFILEQHTGSIRILRLPSLELEPTPFLTIPGIATANEQGLLGLAFHPNYAFNGLFYVYITDPDTKVFRYQRSFVDPDVANPLTQTQVLEIAQPQPNHNAGWLGFGPSDGYLYIGSGDGGGGYDTGVGHTDVIGNAQDLTDNLLGKILRIDVDSDAFPGDATRNYAIPPTNPFVGIEGDDEIWAYGLRNPFRASFDRLTHDLYIGDVGQDNCEEIDFQPADSPGGENYGWRLREGTQQTPLVGGPAPAGAIEPIMDYPHPFSGSICSNPGLPFEGFVLTGGVVYRGIISELQGRYFFADFSTGDIWSLRFDGSDPVDFDGTNYSELTDHSTDPRFAPDMGNIAFISSFGEDAMGNLYLMNLFDGDVFRVPEPSAASNRLAAVLALGLLARVRRTRGIDRSV